MAAPLFNTRDRGGLPWITNTSDLIEGGRIQTKPNTAYHVLIWVLAFRVQTNTQAACYLRRALFRTDSSGTLTQVGTTATIGTDIEDAAGWNVDIVVGSSNEISIKVGADGTPTNWNLQGEVQVVDLAAQPY